MRRVHWLSGGVLNIRKFSRGFIFAYAKFREIKSSRNDEITLSVSDTDTSRPYREFQCRKYAIRENETRENFRIYST